MKSKTAAGKTAAVKSIRKIMESGKKTLFIGLGNRYRTDDAFGVMFAERMKNLLGEGGDAVFFSAERNLLDALPVLDEKAPEIVVMADASDMGKSPGEIVVAEYEDSLGKQISTHENNYAMFSAYVEENIPNCRILLLLVQFQSVEMSDENRLTPPVAETLENIIEGLT